MKSSSNYNQNPTRTSKLEEMNESLRDENQRMSLKLSEKVQMIEDLKLKYSKIEKSNSEVEALHSENAALNVEVSRLKDELARYKSFEVNMSKFKTNIEVLMTEKQELNILLNEKEKIILEFRGKLKGLKSVESPKHILDEKDRIICELSSKLTRLEEQVLEVNEWKSKALALAAENQRLVRSLEEKTKEIESMGIQVSHQPIEITHQVKVMSVQEGSRVEMVLAEKTRECEALRMKLAEKEKATVTSVKSEYVEKNVIVSNESEKLTEIISVKQKEIESLSAKLAEYHDIDAKLKLSIQEKNKLMIERDSAIKERTRLEARLIEKDHEYDVLKVKLRDSEKPSQEVLELREKLTLMISEKERLNTFMIEKQKEIEALNAQYLEHHDLQLKLKLSIEENNKLIVLKETAVQDRKRLEIIVSEITEEYEALRHKFAETEKMYQELSEVKENLSIMTCEVERLNNLLIEKENLIESVNVKLAESENQNSELRVTIEENQKVIENNVRIMKENNRVIVEKEREFESHKTQVVRNIETVRNVETIRNVETDFIGVRSIPSSPTTIVIKQENNVLNAEISRLDRELSMRVDQIKRLEERVALLLVENKQLSQEKEIIDTTFSCEIKELESLRLRSSEVNIVNMQLKMYESEKEETLKLMEKDKRTFERSLHEKELLIKDLQAKIMAYEQQISYLSEFKAKLSHATSENERLVVELQVKGREIESLRNEWYQLNVRNSTKVVVQENHTSEILLNEKAREISALKLRIAQLEKGSYLSEELSEKLKISSIKYEAIISNLNERMSEMEGLRLRCSQLSDIEAKLVMVMRERDEAINLERLNRQEISKYQEKLIKLETQVVELNTFKHHQINSPPRVVRVETKSIENEQELNYYKQEIAKYQERVIRLEGQLTELRIAKSHQVQVISSPPRVVHVETKNVEVERELNVYKQEIAKYQEKSVKLEAQVTELTAFKAHQAKITSSPAKVIQVEAKNVEKETELNGVIADLKSKLSLAIQEKEKLTVIVSQKESEKEEAIKEKNKLTAIIEEYSREIETVRVSMQQIEVSNLEKQRLLEIISTKTKEIEMLEQKLVILENEKNNLKQIACEKEKIIGEMELKVFAKSTVNEIRRNHEISFGNAESKTLKNSRTEKSLKTNLSHLTGFNEEFQSVVFERDQLEVKVVEKQKNIHNLQAKVTSAEKELASSIDLKSKVTLLDSESKRLNHVAMERLAKLNASEQQLKESTKEKSLLGLEVSEKQVELGLLKAKIVELEKQAKLVTELQGKLAMMILENERLTKDLDEKNQVIADYTSKYATLENLYLHVRGNMKKPEANEKKYQDIIRAIEQVEHKLGLYGRSKALKKTLSVQSILQPDNSQSYSLAVEPMTDSKVFPATTKNVTVTERVYSQKAMY